MILCLFADTMHCLGIRTNEDGVPEDEENFDEAIKAVNTALYDNSMPQNLSNILEHPFSRDISSEVRDLLSCCLGVPVYRYIRSNLAMHKWLSGCY